jgi:taurine dioxygenase
VELPGLDPDRDIAALRAGLRTHLVVVLPGAAPTPEAQLALTARLGAPVRHPLDRLRLPGRPEVVLEQPGDDDRDTLWHADLTWAAEPAGFSALAAFGMAAGAGEVATEFASGVAAYDRLDPWLRERIEFLEAEHDHPRRRAAGLPPAIHPLVRLDPETGRRSLLLDSGTARRVVGLPRAEGEDLLHRLHAVATHPAIVLRHHWRPGDLVLWDNRSVLHRACFTAAARLHRTMVGGARPIGPRQLAIPWVSAG